jgi:hypothetical protein
VRGCENEVSALQYSTLYETRSPGVGFPGCKIFIGLASILAEELSISRKPPMAQSLAPQ